MKTTFIFTFLLFFSLNLFSQSGKFWNIKGRVGENINTPLPFANVFINNTSIGTTTDELGFFVLNIPDVFKKVDLIISFIGYKTVKQSISINDVQKINLSFILNVEINLLKEVKVTAKTSRDWNRRWRQFEQALFGESDYADDCSILNKEVIRLDYEDDSKKLIATATQPIIILNRALGYKLTLTLLKFETDAKITYLAGYKFFEVIKPESEKIKNKQDKNIKDAYKNSFRNFLASLAHNSLERDDFEVFRFNYVPSVVQNNIDLEAGLSKGDIQKMQADSICKYDVQTKQNILISDAPLIIFNKNKRVYPPIFSNYPYLFSQIILPRGFCTFSENGWLINPNGILLKDFWGREGIANLLPENFNVESVQRDTININAISIKRDSLILSTKYLQIPEIKSQEMVLLKENSVKIEEEKVKTIATNDYTIKLTEDDVNYSIFRLLRKIPGLRVIEKGNSLDYQIFFVEKRVSNFNDAMGGSGKDDHTPALLLDGVLYDERSTVIAILNSVNLRQVKTIGAVRFGNGAAFGVRGANGTIVITTK